jgi:hypothetical protein
MQKFPSELPIRVHFGDTFARQNSPTDFVRTGLFGSYCISVADRGRILMSSRFATLSSNRLTVIVG